MTALALGGDVVELGSSTTIATDALTRIPTVDFLDMAWARSSIASCAAMYADAAGGNRSGLARWLEGAAEMRDTQPAVSVLRAVGDAIVADSFRVYGDVGAVSAFIGSLEGELLAALALHRERQDAEGSPEPGRAELVQGMLGVVALADPALAQRAEATAVLAGRIAAIMQLPAEQIALIEHAGRLLEIGTLGEPFEGHSAAGAATLLATPQLAALAPIVRAHHERIDGDGFPDRLRADEIPLEARVLAVADAFVALTSDRPDRRAFSPRVALDALAAEADTRLDAAVVDAIFALLDAKRQSHQQIA